MTALSPTPGAEDGQCRSGFWAQDVEHRLGAGLHAAREWAEQFERGFARNLDHAAR